MNKDELQIRSIATGLHLREDAEGRTIEGHAVVTGVETVLWEGSDYREIEVIEPSCINDAFIKEQDVKANLYHNRETTIARNNKGEGNLQLECREDGLHFTFEAPECDLGERALQLCRQKVITGCSFEFYPQDYEVEERTAADGKEEYIVRHKAFRALTAVTLALDPAYEQTSVKAREEYREKHPVTQHVEQTTTNTAAKREAVNALKQEAAKIFA